MSEWESRPIEELVALVSSGGTPRAGDPRYYTEFGTPFLKIDDITKSIGRFVDKAEQSITDLALDESAAKIFPAGTVLVTMYGTMGVTKTLRSPMATNQAIAALVPPFECDPTYLAHALSFRRAGLERLAAQTTQPNISGTIIRRFRLPVPPLEEQRRIAEVLDTIDETIQATERVIAKRRVLRAGLAADLLKVPSAMSPSETSKPNETMPPHDSTNIFEISDMPERTETLGQYVRLQTSQIVPAAFPSESFDHYSIPAFDETGGAIPTTGATIESGKFLLSEPAVLVSKLNPRKMRVQLFSGRSANRAVASTEFMVYEPRENADISIQFLAHLLNGNDFAQRLQSTATGTTNSHVRARPKETLRWPVSIPRLEEQRRIAEVLDTVDGATQRYEAELVKLGELRAGVATDLLSGRVRTVAA